MAIRTNAASERAVGDESAVLVAVCQFAPNGDRAANLAAIRTLALQARDRGAQLAVFPEYSSFFLDPVDSRFLAAAEPLDGAFVSALTELADETGIHIVAGMAESLAAQGESGRFANAVVAVGPGHGIRALYRKQHLYDAFGARESDVVAPGKIEHPQVFAIDGLIFGLQTCYDLRFPEVTRRIVDAGARAVLVPSEWVRGPLKEHHWRTLIAARAIENTAYVIAADHVPPIGVGASVIVDPMGITVADAAEQPGIAIASVALSRVESVRALNPALRLRRYTVEPGIPSVIEGDSDLD